MHRARMSSRFGLTCRVAVSQQALLAEEKERSARFKTELDETRTQFSRACSDLAAASVSIVSLQAAAEAAVRHLSLLPHTHTLSDAGSIRRARCLNGTACLGLEPPLRLPSRRRQLAATTRKVMDFRTGICLTGPTWTWRTRGPKLGCKHRAPRSAASVSVCVDD
jgi:hypothetical protein